MNLRALSDRPIVAAFLFIIAAFCLSTAIGHVFASRIDAASDSLAFDSSPSIAHLAAARGDVRALEFEVYRYLRAREEGRPATRDAVQERVDHLNAELDGYLRLPLHPGERDYWTTLREAQLGLVDAVGRAMSEADRGPRPPAALEEAVKTAAERTLDALGEAIEFHAGEARTLALSIKRTRRNAALGTAALDGLAIALGALAVVLVRRTIARKRQLAAEQTRHLEERTRELDIFAGRVAHDVMSPIGAAGLAFDLIQRTSSDERVKSLAAKGAASVRRSRSIVDDLLEFTRAGAPSGREAASDLAEVVAGVVAEIGPSAIDEEIELVVEPLPPCRCRCSDGVLMSLVYNLLRNAIKYMGDAPVRRVVLRARVTEGTAHVEVEDSGPGLAPELGATVFEPFVRAHGSTRQGLGLGLATVKRLAEGHGGRVGLRSRPGEGALFWFELPLSDGPPAGGVEAGPSPEAAGDETSARVRPAGVDRRARDGVGGSARSRLKLPRPPRAPPGGGAGGGGAR